MARRSKRVWCNFIMDVLCLCARFNEIKNSDRSRKQTHRDKHKSKGEAVALQVEDKYGSTTPSSLPGGLNTRRYKL